MLKNLLYFCSSPLVLLETENRILGTLVAMYPLTCTVYVRKVNKIREMDSREIEEGGSMLDRWPGHALLRDSISEET